MQRLFTNSRGLVAITSLVLFALGAYAGPPEADLRRMHNFRDLSQMVGSPCVTNDESYVVSLRRLEANGSTRSRIYATAQRTLLTTVQAERSSNAQMMEFVGQGCSSGRWVFGLRSLANGKYVRAGVGAQALLAAESTAIRGWEKFVVQPHPSNAAAVALLSLENRRFVAVQGDSYGATAVAANRAAPVITYFDYWSNNFDRPWGRVKARSGQQPVLVLAVEWADNPVSFHRNTCANTSNAYTLSQLNQMIFSGNRPSVASWFAVNSQSRLQITSAGVWGSRVLQNGTQQPCQVGSPGCDFARSSVSKANGGNLMALITESLALVDQQVNFRQFDRNSDGIVDSTELTIFHFLTHERCRSDRGGYKRDIPRYVTNDGVTIAEVASNGSAAATFSGALHVYAHASLFTANHEMIHAVLGGDDMYSEWSRVQQSANGGTASIPDVFFRGTGGAFSNMAQGGRSSTMLDPVVRLKAGWMNPQLAYRSGWYEIQSSSSSADALIVHNPQHGTDEYLILEYRTLADAAGNPTLDAGSPGIANFPSPLPRVETVGRPIPEEGLALWRMAEQPYASAADSRNLDPRHAVQLMPVSGLFGCIVTQLQGNTINFVDSAGNVVGAIANAPGDRAIRGPVLMNPAIPGSVYTISDESSPLALRWVDGTRTGIRISGLSKVGDRLRFHVSITPLAVEDAPLPTQSWGNPLTGNTSRYPAHPPLVCP